MSYDAPTVRAYFDTLGAREWERLEATLQGRIKYAIHRRFLDASVDAGLRVLDVGCGPGRFALDLARRGTRLTCADLSPTQLELARRRLETEGLLGSVEAFHCLDVVAMPVLADAAFDAVVCYGATLSYTRERYGDALRELNRVLRPGGRLLLSVGSVFGTLRLAGPLDAHAFLEQPDTHIDWLAVLARDGVVYTRPGSPEFHQSLVLFTADGLRRALTQVGLQVVVLAAANPVVSTATQIPGITASGPATDALTELEVALCDWPGLVDTGEHLLAVAFKP